MIERLSSTRKTCASLGDDTTLTRFVKIKKEGGHKVRKLQPRLAGIGVPAFVSQGRTKFPSRVLQVGGMNGSVMSSGHSNVKIGRDVRKGHYRGYWIYLLSLEERKTCPTNCALWQNCYGNSSPFAKRVNHDDPEFLPALEAQIDKLCKLRYGVLIRLHQLGDFYSSQYVHFWTKMLDRHPNLAIYGYTAHLASSTIGSLVGKVRARYGRRFSVRHSNDASIENWNTVTLGTKDALPATAFLCPEQSELTACCATCGACWGTGKTVGFLEH